MGGEYHVGKHLDIRLGVLYDPSPIPSEYLHILNPDSSRSGITAGLGYEYKNLFFDFAYMMFFSEKREESSNFQAIFDMYLNAIRGSVLALSFGLKF
jgi:long-subunit fatty acid transport protein